MAQAVEPISVAPETQDNPNIHQSQSQSSAPSFSTTLPSLGLTWGGGIEL